jgi:hypothetical protein
VTFDPAADVTSILDDLKATGIGVEVVYNGVTVSGVYDEEFSTQENYADLSASFALRAVLVRKDVLTGLARNTPIAVGGTIYTIREWQPAGQDGSMIRLILVTL